MATLPVALQLYTVREDLESDYVGTLRKVAEIGYPAVEFTGSPVMKAGELRALLQELGLQAVAWPISLEEWEDDPISLLRYAQELGCSYVMFPFVPEHRRGDAGVYRDLARLLTRAAAKAKEYGLLFAYHNHAFEFERMDGRYALDILFESADRELVTSELDVYWAQYGGADPAAYIRKLGRRCTLIHMKDMAADADRSFAEIGEGLLDMDAIVAAGQEVGAAWYIVEQDRATKRSPMAAARLSFENMRAKGWA
jgi:sugar phosphate isomerase/epimerase